MDEKKQFTPASNACEDGKEKYQVDVYDVPNVNCNESGDNLVKSIDLHDSTQTTIIKHLAADLEKEELEDGDYYARIIRKATNEIVCNELGFTIENGKVKSVGL